MSGSPRRLVRALCLIVWALPCVTVRGQTLLYDHMHFGAPDPEKAAEWYVSALGAKRGSLPDRVIFGRTIFAFTKIEHPLPSAGSVIDHVAFSVADVDAAMRTLQKAGAKVITPSRDVPGLFRAGVVEDPWGARLELVQDPVALGFHHVHLRMPDPSAGLNWYAATFGGERTKLKGRLDSLKYTNPDVWLVIDKADDVVPSQGHAIDHLGWAVANVDEKTSELAGKGLKTVAPRDVRNLRVSFVEGPAGARIELVQGREEQELIGR